jgi:tetratricopeptide (TPR) repeat protein
LLKAHLDLQEGVHAQARRACEEALSLLRRAGRACEEHEALRHSADLLRLQGQLDDAFHLYQQAARFFQAQEARRLEATTLISMGALHRDRCQVDEASLALERANDLAMRCTDARLEAHALIEYARLHRFLEDYGGALELLQQALQHLDHLQAPTLRAAALAEQGHTLLAQRRRADAPLETLSDTLRGLNLGPDSPTAQALASLQRAQHAHLAGRTLVYGQAVEDLPVSIQKLTVVFS